MLVYDTKLKSQEKKDTARTGAYHYTANDTPPSVTVSVMQLHLFLTPALIYLLPINNRVQREQNTNKKKEKTVIPQILKKNFLVTKKKEVS